MHPKYIFSVLTFLLLIGSASAVPVSFSDINLQDRAIAIYEVDENGTHLVSTPDMVTSNATIELDAAKSYQIIIQPDKNTWFDDPLNALSFLVSDNMGQTIVFMMFAFIFAWVMRLIFR